MGRWSYSSRWTTEECKSIPVKFLNEHHYFDGGVRWGGMNWTRGGEKTGRISFVVSTVEGDEYIRFRYTQTDRHWGEKSDLDYKAGLDSTPCHFGSRKVVVYLPSGSQRPGLQPPGRGLVFSRRKVFRVQAVP